MVNILSNHHENSGKAVGLVGHMSDNLYRTFSEKLISVIILDDYRTKAYKSHFSRRDSYKLNAFVLTASSKKQFTKIVNITKSSKWWNPAARYLIVNWSGRKQRAPVDYLIIAWKSNMVDASVIRQNRTEGIKLYGYNRYIYRIKRFHPFTVFSRDYENSDGISETLGAEMAKNLGGYRFRVLKGKTDVISKLKKESRLHSLELENVYHILASTLNATLGHMSCHEKDLRNVYYRSKGYMIKLRFAITAAATDTVATFSYPCHREELLAMTKFRGHLTQLEKILGVIDVSSRIGLCLVLLLTLLFFIYFLRHSVMASLLNVFRIVCNTGFRNVPENVWPRMYIATVLLVAVVMQGIYQGDLAALLTQVMPIRDAMTKQDLVDLGYKIYIFDELAAASFSDPMFDGHVVEIGNRNCRPYVHSKPMAACVYYAYGIKIWASEKSWHVVAESMGSMYTMHMLPIDTHLEDRINKILQTMLEADIMVHLRLRGQERNVLEFEFDEDVKKNQIVKVMTLGELEFAFVILGIGLTCAAITFLGELAIARYRSRTRTTRI